ncbi:MAG: hypothetical protein RRY69_07775 [Oscillospiraceae bacterium]
MDDIFKTDDFFEDVTASENEDSQTDGASESATNTETQTTEPQADAAKAQPGIATEPNEPTDSYIFKHNHESVKLDRKTVDSLAKSFGTDPAAVIATLQKGRDYDAKMAALKKNPAFEAVRQYSALNDMPPSEAAEEVARVTDRIQIGKIVEQVKAERPGIDDAIAEEVAGLRFEQLRAKKSAELQRQNEEQEKAKIEPWIALLKKHPELSDNEVDELAKRCALDECSPTEAFLQRELDQKKEELAKVQKQTENRVKSIGSVNAEAGENAEDPSLAAFMAAFR